MARSKKSAAAARVCDKESDSKPRNPAKPKPVSPQKKNTNSRKGRKAEQQATVDEGIAATPDDTSLQAQVDNNDSTYDSSPQKQSATSTPLQTPARKNAPRSNRSKKAIVGQTLGSFEAEQAGRVEAGAEAGAADPSPTYSKVVVLKIAPHKLRQITKSQTAPEVEVTLQPPSTRLRQAEQKSVTGNLRPLPAVRPEGSPVEEAEKMAPVKDKNAHDLLDDGIKDIIQNLYDIGSITHGFLPESQGPLVQKGLDLPRSLAALSDLIADDSTHPAAQTIRSIRVPPEVIDYVSNGRNPDIYTREFVENVNRGNHVLNGKMQAFGTMAEIYARETKSAMPDLAADTDRLMELSGGFEKDAETGDWKMKKPEAKDPETRDWQTKKPDTNGS